LTEFQEILIDYVIAASENRLKMLKITRLNIGLE